MNRNTILYNSETMETDLITDIINKVYAALEEKGYDPIAQLAGYILSGDPSYITSHNNARSLIKHVDRDDMVEELLRNFLNITPEEVKEEQ
ncbi:MAG: IreB family regulatory phosphoprotein [Firmicutes bacterium]|nr:IreB family regulatory phosphoprotein [Bacillota bacterium]